MKVGFIGLGRMGQAMSARVLGGGHDLVVYNRTTEKTAEIAKAGAKVAPSIAAACEGREVVISIVADDAAVKEVALNAGGVRDSLKAGAIHLVMGTHSVATVQLLAAAHTQAKQNMVSAPVLGMPECADAGQLLVGGGGPHYCVRPCAPVFRGV